VKLPMNLRFESDQEAARQERAIGWLRDRTGEPLTEVRRLFAREFSRLEVGAKIRSYLSVLTVSNVRANIASQRGIGHMTTATPEPVAAVNSKRFLDNLERRWQERLRPADRGLTRGYLGKLTTALDAAIHYLVPKFTNATSMLKEQLTEEGVSVWLSPGCLEEFSSTAKVAAARTRQAGEPYTSCLRREIVARAQFIRQWTNSDGNFDLTEFGELVSVARKYALPRPWRLIEAVASVNGQATASRRIRATSAEEF